MPFDTVKAIANREEYKKTMKKDLAKVKAAPTKFYFFNQFSFGDKTAPLLLVGKVKPDVLAEVQSQAKLSGKGTCTRGGDDALTFQVKSGKVAEDRLQKAVKSAGSTGAVKIVEDSTKTPKDPFAGDQESKANSKSLKKTSKFSPERGKIDARNRTIYAKVNEILKTTEGPAKVEIETAKSKLEEELVKADKNKKYDGISALQDALVNAAKKAYPEAKEKASFTKAKQKLDNLTKLVETRYNSTLSEAGLEDKDKLTKLKKEVDDAIPKATKAAEVKSLMAKVGDLVELINEINPRNAIRKEDIARINEAKQGIEEAEDAVKILEKAVEDFDTPDKIKGAITVATNALFGKKKGSQAYNQLVARKKELEEKYKKYEELGEAMAKVELAKQKEMEAQDIRLKRGQAPKTDPGKIDQGSVSKDVKDFAKKAGEATKWQMDQLKDDDKHGTGRHGAQTGMERQARRLATGEEVGTDDQGKPIISGGVTPDQKGNAGGTAQRILKWKTTIKYKPKVEGGLELEKGENGKFIVTNPKAVLKEIKKELESREFATETTSNFLNPALEKEAVDKAIAIATQCVWNEVSWKNDGTFEELNSLAITVGPPSSAKGYGHSFERGAAFVKKSLVDANAAIKDFEDGKLTPDAFLAKLNITMVKDDEGTGAKIMPHATVVLTRSGGSGGWKNKTQYPTGKTAEWSINRKDVRKFGEADIRAGNYT